VDTATLEMLLACAQSAPSKSDLNQYSIIVVRDQARKDFVGGLLPAMAWIKDSAVFLLFCADIKRGRDVTEAHELEHDSDTLDSFMNASVDAGLAMMAFIAAAESVGLGCCPISAVREHLHELCPAFGIPDGVFPVAGLCLGWPADPDPRRLTLRPPPAAVVHHERYGQGADGTPADHLGELAKYSVSSKAHQQSSAPYSMLLSCKGRTARLHARAYRDGYDHYVAWSGEEGGGPRHARREAAARGDVRRGPGLRLDAGDRAPARGAGARAILGVHPGARVRPAVSHGSPCCEPYVAFAVLTRHSVHLFANVSSRAIIILVDLTVELPRHFQRPVR
jgi:nitroreductase